MFTLKWKMLLNTYTVLESIPKQPAGILCSDKLKISTSVKVFCPQFPRLYSSFFQTKARNLCHVFKYSKYIQFRAAPYSSYSSIMNLCDVDGDKRFSSLSVSLLYSQY